jgi:hypothetical protein
MCQDCHGCHGCHQQETVTVPPLTASIIVLFQDRAEWSLSELASELEVRVSKPVCPIYCLSNMCQNLCAPYIVYLTYKAWDCVLLLTVLQATNATVRQRLAYWLSMGIIKEESSERFVLDEEGQATGGSYHT